MTCYLHNVYTFLLNLRKLQLLFIRFFSFQGYTCWHSISFTQKSQAAALSGTGLPPHFAWCLLPTISMPVSDSSSVHFLGEACLISLARSNALIIILSRHNLTCICMNIDFFSLQNVYFVCPLQHSRTHTEPGTEKVVNKLLRSRIRLPP